MAQRVKQGRTPVKGRVLLAEDDEFFAKPLRDKMARFQIECDWVTNFTKATEALRSTTYHAALIDIYLQSDKPQGLDLVRIVTECGIPSIILTSRLDLGIAKQGLNNGAEYVIEKPFEIQELLRVLEELWENPKGLIARRERFLEIHSLTEKEKELTRLILKGLSNQEIANVSGTSVATVKFYTNQIFQKCEVRNRPELFNSIFPT